MSLFPRLRLVKDLAIDGERLLDRARHDADAVRGMSVLDMALEISFRIALDATSRTTTNDKFNTMLDALTELAPLAAGLKDFHRVRNNAHHTGTAPPAASRGSLCRDAVAGLRETFQIAGSDFERFSSVPQVQAEYFRSPLELALGKVANAPNEAVALAGRVFYRVQGWASQITGDAMIPGEMWVFETPLWNDAHIRPACGDGRDDFIHALVSIAGAQAMGIPVSAFVRLRKLMHGHFAEFLEAGLKFTHEDDATDVTQADVEWLIELVARSIIKLEEEWPDFVLVSSNPPMAP
jgi:hypothetical protein